MTTAILETHDSFLSDFEAEAPQRANEPQELAALRQEAMGRFRALGFPTPREEDWRFTNVGAIARTRFVRAEPESVAQQQIEPYLYDGMARAVFVNGYFAPELSELDDLPGGVTVGSLREALERRTEGTAQLGRHASFERQAFVALNTALFADGAFVRIPRGVVMERPLLLLFVTVGGGQEARASYPRTLLLAEEASQATVVESYVGLGDGAYLDCPVTEIVAGPAAVVDHYRVQRESLEGYHIALQQLRCDRAANVSSHALSFGAALARTDVRALLAGEGVDCTLNGLYLTRGRQHVDHHMWVEHAAPHCDSHELYKGILEDRSRAVFNGLIHVHEGAQKTDAKQTNRNLLLSQNALVNTNPQLRIFADDVKCTHGSTVGQLDADAVFYLRSRGIGEDAAKSLLTWAFASEVVERIRLAAVRHDLEELLFDRLPRGEVVRQAV